MNIIDAQGKLNPTRMKAFFPQEDFICPISILLDNDNIDVDSLEGQNAKEKIFDFFIKPNFEEQIVQHGKKTIIRIQNPNHDLEIQFLLRDYLYWKKSIKQLAKLLELQIDTSDEEQTKIEKKEKTEKKESKPRKSSKIELSVACALRDETIHDIEQFRGSQKDAIEFLNNVFTKYQIKFADTCEIVFNIAFDTDEELNCPDNWFTFSELSSAGVFIEK